MPIKRFIAAFTAFSLIVNTAGGVDSQPQTEPTDQWKVEGIVVDANGSGVGGAKVRLEWVEEGKEPLLLGETTTNATGDIAMGLKHPASNHLKVHIVKNGFKDYVSNWEPDLQQPSAFIDATLAGAGRLTGKVTSALAPKPLPGVFVTCTYGGLVQTMQTDEAGVFHFEDLANGQAVLFFEKQGFGREKHFVATGQAAEELDVALEPERGVRLMFEDASGKRFPNVTFEVWIEPAHYSISAVTDEQGIATLHGVHPESRQVRIRFLDDRLVRPVGGAIDVDLPRVTSAPAEGGEVTRTVQVRAAARIEGRVTDGRSGEPVVGVRIVIGPELRADMPMTWTDPAGDFALGGLEPGACVLSFQHPDYATEIRERRLSVGQPTHIDVGLEPGAPIEGLVVDEENNPLGSVAVSAENWRGFHTLGLRMLTTDDGKFAFAHAPQEGEVVFAFSKPGYQRKATVELTAGKTNYRIELPRNKAATPPLSAVGEHKLANGQQAPDLRIRLMDGKVVQLSELRGKYIFLECWASWCGPCRGEIPHLKKLYDQVKDRPDFVMIGLSLDHSEADLKAALKSHAIPWPQAFGPGSGAEEVFAALGGEGIPYNCLIGPDGKILAQELRGTALVPAVEHFAPPATQPQ